MATVKINLNLEDAGKSVKARTDEVKGLNKELEKTQRLSTGTKSGSSAVKSSYMGGEGTEYGRARGGMGATGAAGRDFANQAQGLGGLVRLYATYAANVFAVSAAFNALSQAMNTTNMVQGLDQLGAASGVALGSLAKRFEQASGGAISLRESMEATAKAVSSGLSQTQFLKLGEVAKKASQALGVNMSDAVSRLTRGITKLEPELLDELGIFTKVGKATEDYARSVGKSANALTDFERRQAFANAVLAEGAQKFGEINIPTNPYDKLLATLKNVAQSIGEVINVALVPLVSLLASSPAALTLGIAALGSTIVKQAIPAIGEYRKSLKEAAAVSKGLADEKLKRAVSAAESRRQDIEARSQASAEAAAIKLGDLENKIREQAKGRIRKDVLSIISTGNILDIKDTQVNKLDEISKKLKNQDNIYSQLAATIRKAKDAALDNIKVQEKIDVERKTEPGKASTIGVLRADAERQRKSAAGSAIISQAGDTAAIDGFRVAYTEMVDKIKTEKLGLVRGALTGIAGAANAAVTRLGGLINAFSGWIVAITTVIAAYQMLSGWLSENSAEQEKLNETLTTGTEAVKALNLTYDKYRTSLSSDAIIATATAFTNLSDNISATVKALQAADAKSGVFDRLVDGFKSVFGQDLKSDFERGIAYQVSEGLKGITDPKLKKSAEDKLKELLGIQTLTAKAISGALDDIDKSEIIAKGSQIATIFEAASRAGQKTAGTLTSIKDGFTALDKAYTTLANSLTQKDPLTDFGKELAMQGFNLAEAFKDPVASVSALRDILTDVSKLKLLSPESQQVLLQSKDAFLSLASSAEFYEKLIVQSEKRVKSLETQRDSRLNKAPIQKQIDREQADLSRARDRLSDTKSGLEVISKDFARASELSIKKGFELVEGSFSRAIAAGVLSNQKALLDYLPKTTGTIDLSVSLENRKLELQKEQILETQRLIKEMELLPIRLETALLSADIEKIIATETSGPVRQAARDNPRLKELEEREKTLTSKNISKDIESKNLKRTPETLAAMQQQQGAFARVAAIASEQQMNIIKGQVDKVNARYVRVKSNIDNDLKQAVQDREDYMRGEGFRRDTLEEQQDTIAAFTAREALLNKEISLLENSREITTATTIQLEARKQEFYEIAALAGIALKNAEKQFDFTNRSLDKTIKLNEEETDIKNKLALQLEAMKLQNIEEERNITLAKITSDSDIALLGIRKQELQLQYDKGLITLDIYNQEVYAIEKVDRAKQKEAKTAALVAKYTLDALAYAKELASATVAQLPEIRARFAALQDVYTAEIDGVAKVFIANEKLAEQQRALPERQQAYADLFTQAFKSMEDAIVEFTKTGKLNFSSMIESFIEGLLRFEIQQQQMAIFQSMGGARGLAGSLITAGFTLFDTNTAGNSMYDAGLNQMAPSAKGNAFDYGIQAFAKGGAFTNSIVDSPTMFRFAKGTGLMGEAGPEAIMPLTRDGSGNLGVRANGGGANVDVVVNNYGNEKATTKETVDSRGNRRIEVTVGDMVAQEVTRTGSAAQTAFSSTYGTRPALARR